MNAVLYVHGKGGSADEAERFVPLFPSCRVTGLDYRSDLPWEAGAYIKEAVLSLSAEYGRIILIANSIGAFFVMNAGIEKYIDHAYFISPIVDMENLILDMMRAANVSRAELMEKGSVHTASGEDLSWDYLSFVQNNPVKWNANTYILYGSEDALTPSDTIAWFSKSIGADLTVMEGGEHWFHTEEQFRFLENWIKGKESARPV
ncbi:MAG: alpha/beta hydrolase [Oscillospiraceae bacterium]|nr:alpha/beta hydrolase [Oscillospiraceae bacterium]